MGVYMCLAWSFSWGDCMYIGLLGTVPLCLSEAQALGSRVCFMSEKMRQSRRPLSTIRHNLVRQPRFLIKPRANVHTNTLNYGQKPTPLIPGSPVLLQLLVKKSKSRKKT